jgi:S-methylmethionine-dependent homocysteine/selenocysteine methylase
MSPRITVLDGGMGRELLRIGAPFRQPEWSALALTEGPEWVVQAHTNFIDAGADMITTNSYAIVPFHIGNERFEVEALDLAGVAGRCARSAADTASRAIRVAGSLPPLFGSYRPDLFDSDEAPRIIDPLVEGLLPHVDLWLGETLSSIAEAVAVRRALERIGDSSRPLWISFTLDDSGPATLRSGELVSEAVRAASDLGAAVVLFNCSQAETIRRAIPIAVAASPGSLEVGGYANRFVESHTELGEANDHLTEYRYDLDPSTYSRLVAQWIEDGASIVGGCCGIGPDHIAEIAALATP